MSQNTAANPKWMTVVGWALSVLPCLLLLFSAWAKLSKSPQVIEGFAGYKNAESMPMVLGSLELACTLLFLFPRTAVLGAVLLTGYLGGAVHTHVYIGDGKWFIPAALGAILWLGLFLRDARIRSLLPLRS